jgi:hypothetical protein
MQLGLASTAIAIMGIQLRLYSLLGNPNNSLAFARDSSQAIYLL